MQHAHCGPPVMHRHRTSAVQAMMENLKAKDSLHEVNPPEGALKATLHPYQKQSLAWMLKNERGQSNRGGLLAGQRSMVPCTFGFSAMHSCKLVQAGCLSDILTLLLFRARLPFAALSAQDMYMAWHCCWSAMYLHGC